MSLHHVSHKDIAERLHLTQSTVSRALDTNPEKNQVVKQSTRELIQAVAREMGYRPNRQASFLKRGRNATILCFLPDVSYTLTADLMFGISEAARQENFPVNFLTCSSQGDYRRFLRDAVSEGNSGVLSYPPQKLSSGLCGDMTRYVSGGGNLVFLNVVSNTPGYGEVPEEFSDIAQVNIDDDYGGELAARHLMEQGCRRFFYLSSGGGCYLRRYRGFSRYLESQGAVCESVQRLDWSSLVTGVSEKTGIFASYDMIALQAYVEAVRAGVSLGEEVLLMGYDDLFHCRPLGLTSVHQPMREAGGLAVRKLIGRILGHAEESESILPSLIIRESTGGKKFAHRESVYELEV